MPLIELLMEVIHGQVGIGLPLTVEKPISSSEYPFNATLQMKDVSALVDILVCLLLQDLVKMMSLPQGIV